MNFFLPKDRTFLQFLEKRHATLKAMASVLSDFSKSFSRFDYYGKKAKDLEHEADGQTHEIIQWLYKSFITPFDREDIYLLAMDSDDIVDLVESVIHIIVVYKLKKRPPELLPFSALITRASSVMGQLILCLESSRYTDRTKKLIVTIHELEDEGDALYDELVRKLFSQPNDPVEIMKRKEILDNLESVMDKFQRVSDIIGGILIKFS